MAFRCNCAFEAAIVVAVLALVPMARVDPIFRFQMFMGRGQLASEDDDSLRRVETHARNPNMKPPINFPTGSSSSRIAEGFGKIMILDG